MSPPAEMRENSNQNVLFFFFLTEPDILSNCIKPEDFNTGTMLQDSIGRDLSAYIVILLNLSCASDVSGLHSGLYFSNWGKKHPSFYLSLSLAIAQILNGAQRQGRSLLTTLYLRAANLAGAKDKGLFISCPKLHTRGGIRPENLTSCQTVFDLLLAYFSKSVLCVVAFWFVYFFCVCLLSLQGASQR